MEEKILKSICESLGKGKKVALVTITNMLGSTPRKKGSLMAVWEDGSIEGSVGGGNIEYAVIEKAIQCIKEGEDKELQFQLNDEGDLHMQCGGKATLYVKVFKPSTKLLIIGAGHVGVELFKQAKLLDFYTVVFDDREDFANDRRFPEAEEILVGNMGEMLSKYPIDNNTYIVIVTRGHKCDAEALKAVVQSEAAYIGMIGSRKKTEFVMKGLLSDGIDRELLKKVYAPIGINIASEQPNEIALGIMSEVLLVKNKGTLESLRDIKKVSF
ncbi:xanthine dehydrogenase accessory factor [Clostridium amylolyticum]|uniref:Xanthine dehydrogenase accessory factor n=1 Tax=Clostridium amylolyticum TaxID=1121298 RepID=A0A1M6C1I2_9CLOT|nr:XdhC/CoxI family protein [Clostridium amylolyticum]SHI54869.1 xanthine dehydrogenase accessory factor [Clostridium amylolyticum]